MKWAVFAWEGAENESAEARKTPVVIQALTKTRVRGWKSVAEICEERRRRRYAPHLSTLLGSDPSAECNTSLPLDRGDGTRSNGVNGVNP